MATKSANLYARIEPEVKEQAEADLRGIYEYIAFEKLSPENAAGQIDRLEKHIMELESFPKRYKVKVYENYKIKMENN